MKKIKYTPDAADKLREIKKDITERYGADNSRKILKTITDAINELSVYEKKGPAISDLFDVDTDYRYIYTSRNYVFYRIDDDCIRVIHLYNEKEDFMWKLFRIDTTPQETIDYWDD